MKIISKKNVGMQHVYDITVDDNHNFIANGVVAHNSGARRFCLEAKPDSIDELGAITAIYRPGPLKANVHKLYVEAKKNAANIKYGHPIIEEILGPTFGYTVFQEQFMSLASKLSGFTPGESDQLRKTLVKKSLDTMGKKGSEKDIAKQKFIDGALSLNGVDKSVSEPLWNAIEGFATYGFNRSHSIAYAIDSYYAAWLHTHYEKEWLATALQSENGNPKGLRKAIAEIKALNYKFAEIDVNYSGAEWTYSDEIGAFVPPLSSLKGVGDTATEEIMAMRPYTCLNDLLFDEDGQWKHSKMNKTAFRSLCLTEAFNSLHEFKTGTLTNHRQLLAVMTDDKNYDLLRKGKWGISESQLKKSIKNGVTLVPVVDRLIDLYKDLPDWTRVEKVNNIMELTSSINNDLVFPEKMLDKIHDMNLKSVFNIAPDTKDIAWFCITEIIQKTTKNGKFFYRLRILDDENNSGWLRVWSKLPEEPELFTLWVGEIHHDANWGYSTTAYKMKRITAYD